MKKCPICKGIECTNDGYPCYYCKPIEFAKVTNTNEIRNPINIPEYTPKQINPFTREPWPKDGGVEHDPDYTTFGPKDMLPKVDGYWEGCTFHAVFESEEERFIDMNYVLEPKGKSYFYDWVMERQAEAESQIGTCACTSCQVIPPFK